MLQGIVGNVTYEMKTMTNWQMWSLPLDDVSGIPFKKLTAYVSSTQAARLDWFTCLLSIQAYDGGAVVFLCHVSTSRKYVSHRYVSEIGRLE